jgi:hypothetical protein
MMVKIAAIMYSFLYAYFLVISDSKFGYLVTGIVSVVTLIITLINNAIVRRSTDKLKVVSDKVDHVTAKVQEVKENTDGKMNELLVASNAQNKAEGKLETKDELIEVLKHTDAIDDTKK